MSYKPQVKMVFSFFFFWKGCGAQTSLNELLYYVAVYNLYLRDQDSVSIKIYCSKVQVISHDPVALQKAK